MIIKPDLLMQLENILGALAYLIGIAGSYFRFGRYERRGRLDALFMVCITWGYCSLMVSFFNIVKYIFVPSLHIEVIRVLYYGGALVSSLIFFDKNFASGAIKTKLATILVLSTMAFVFGETLIFYLELSYGRAFLSCIGLLLIYFLSLQQRKNVVEILVGVAMILLPILPQLNKGNIDIHKMNLKREIAIRELFEGAPKAPFNQENPEGNSF